MRRLGLRHLFGILAGGVLGWGVTLPTYFSSHFTQTVQEGKGSLNYTGELYYWRGHGLYWHYTSPVEKRIWITRDRVVVYEPDIEQVTISRRKGGLNLEQLLKEAKEVAPGEYTTTVEGREYNFTYRGRLEQIRYRDRLGNLVVIKFTDQRETPLSPSLFTPTYPADVDVIQR